MAPPKQKPPPPKLGYLAPLRQAMRLYYKIVLSFPSEMVDFAEWSASAVAAVTTEKAAKALRRVNRSSWRMRVAAFLCALRMRKKVRSKAFLRACRRGNKPPNRTAPRSKKS